MLCVYAWSIVQILSIERFSGDDFALSLYHGHRWTVSQQAENLENKLSI